MAGARLTALRVALKTLIKLVRFVGIVVDEGSYRSAPGGRLSGPSLCDVPVVRRENYTFRGADCTSMTALARTDQIAGVECGLVSLRNVLVVAHGHRNAGRLRLLGHTFHCLDSRCTWLFKEDVFNSHADRSLE